MISDRNSRRSKGIAYVEFVESSSVPLAIGLTGQRLLGVPIIVQASQVKHTRSVFLTVAVRTLQFTEACVFRQRRIEQQQLQQQRITCRKEHQDP